MYSLSSFRTIKVFNSVWSSTQSYLVHLYMIGMYHSWWPFFSLFMILCATTSASFLEGVYIPDWFGQFSVTIQLLFRIVSSAVSGRCTTLKTKFGPTLFFNLEIRFFLLLVINIWGCFMTRILITFSLWMMGNTSLSTPWSVLLKVVY